MECIHLKTIVWRGIGIDCNGSTGVRSLIMRVIDFRLEQEFTSLDWFLESGIWNAMGSFSWINTM